VFASPPAVRSEGHSVDHRSGPHTALWTRELRAGLLTRGHRLISG
jgi:hypothetical protein